MSRQQIVETLSNPAATPVEQSMALSAASFLEPAELEQMWIDLVSSPNHGHAATAARQLIYDKVDGCTELICKYIINWEYLWQRGILGTLLRSDEPSLFERIPRRVAKAFVDGQLPNDASEEQLSLLTSVGVLLARSHSTSDHELIRQAVVLQPKAYGLWLGLAEIGNVDDTERELAKSIYQMQSNPKILRMAAATVLAPKDAQASEFVLRTIDEFVTEFSSLDFATDVPKLYAGDEALKQKYKRFTEESQLLGMLEYLQVSEAELKTFELLDSPGKWVRDTAALIAISRWPEKFLDKKWDKIPDDDYVKLLSVVSIRHPQLQSKAESKTTPQQLRKVIMDVKKAGTFEAVLVTIQGKVMSPIGH